MPERILSYEADAVLVETALNLQKQIERSTQNAQMGYLPNQLDATIVLGHKSTFLNTDFYNKEPFAHYMDNDRITEAIFLWNQISKNQVGQPIFAYTGAPDECRVFSECQIRNLIQVPKNAIHIIDKVEKDGLKTNHHNTKDNIEAIFQELVSGDSTLCGKTKIVIVSHLAHFIRIPFYIEKFRQIYDPESKIEFFPYSVCERPDARKPFLEREINLLMDYSKKGELSATPAELKYFE